MKTLLKDITIEKSNGRFYTPNFIVCNILDMSGYYGHAILQKHAIDNSCGDGAFLVEMVRRYCEVAVKEGFSSEEIACQLSVFIHGIEIDPFECKKCISNVAQIASKFNIYDVKWDIHCNDSMLTHDYDGKMDFVLGNPPYVRVHNVGDSLETIKTFSFAQNGMTDLYIVFFELGIRMLNKQGVLGYITPSSYFNSIAGEAMRRYLIRYNLIDKIIDLKHYQAFAATTYTAITILKKAKNDSDVSYYQFDEKNQIPYYLDTLTSDDFFINSNFYFSNKQNLRLLKKIFNNLGHCDIAVKNGFATLCDPVFIGDFSFKSKYIIPVIKASTGRKTSIFYPYDRTSKLVPESELQQDMELYRYLLDRKGLLVKRSSDKGTHNYWYAYGRSQAINDTYKNKISINTLIRTPDDLKIIDAPPGTGVYSGLYVIGRKIEVASIQKMLLTEEFIAYISLLGKYKSGGYYTFSSKDLKAFIDYKLAYEGGLLI